MKLDQETFRKILLNAQQALQRGDRQNARRWAVRAAALIPDSEEAWLILAAIASPRASIHYLERALEINPQSQRAQQGMQWALARLRREQPEESSSSTDGEPRIQPEVVSLLPQKTSQPARGSSRLSPKALAKYRWSFLTLLLIAICVTAVWAFWPGSAAPVLAFLRASHSTQGSVAILADLSTPAFTASLPATQPPTETFTPTATFTDTPSPTETPVPTDTPTPTEPIAPTDTPPQTNTETAEPSVTAQPAVEASAGGVRWIDVNLTKQTLYAYEGDTIVKSFLVSTGVKQFPTVTGKYHIYVKYLYTLMHGDGYYLPNVPYTMYFYKSYGIHGTYWHHNFGHPMSHGCVNMYTPDAEWMYYWASVGTLVNIHY